MADNKRIPQKKKTSDFVIYAVIAVILLVVGIWGGYVLQETANMKGEINFQKALDRSSDYANVSSFFAAVNSALTENGIAKKEPFMAAWLVYWLLLISFQRLPSDSTGRAKSTDRHDGAQTKKKRL